MDHYQTLGLTSAATKGEIKEAFRRSALKFHPDRHSNSSPEIQNNASLRFRLASEAYEILADDRRRAEYDLRCRAGWGPSTNHGAPRYGYGGGGGYRRQRAGAGFDGGFVFRYLTGRRFLANIAFASVLFGASVVIQRSGEAIWKMNNSGVMGALTAHQTARVISSSATPACLSSGSASEILVMALHRIALTATDITFCVETCWQLHPELKAACGRENH